MLLTMPFPDRGPKILLKKTVRTGQCDWNSDHYSLDSQETGRCSLLSPDSVIHLESRYTSNEISYNLTFPL
jgi:hypothetical protein